MSEHTQKLYKAGLGEGLQVALRLAEDASDLEDLKKRIADEMRFREVTGIHCMFSNKELDKVGESLKIILCQTMRVAIVASIADTYGFGQTRIRRCIDNFDKLCDYMDAGWLSWMDMINAIKERFGWDLSIESGPEVLKHYYRPLAEDMYEDADLIEDAEWKNALQLAGLREGVDVDGNSCVFEKDEPLIEWENKYQKIQAYDIICGMIFERSRRQENKKTKPVLKKGKKNRRK